MTINDKPNHIDSSQSHTLQNVAINDSLIKNLHNSNSNNKFIKSQILTAIRKEYPNLVDKRPPA